ncbi:hypothetical protein C5748_08180 [Phyllobacterium phragmitis]|uniref:Uncharacterized protein n=1 Tax=Phyllobacterium phragmitis TaxID=2670329 RepID=A0A2S9ITH9_9HYPH|nr:hypothetical protein C5748_08180 [Phyllobacterium phragmitis]
MLIEVGANTPHPTSHSLFSGLPEARPGGEATFSHKGRRNGCTNVDANCVRWCLAVRSMQSSSLLPLWEKVAAKRSDEGFRLSFGVFK